MSDLQLVLKSGIFTSWKSIQVTRDMDKLAAGFKFTVSDYQLDDVENQDIELGMPCEIRIDGETVLTGWIEDYDPVEEWGKSEITIAGKSRTGDLEDCSADFGFPEFNDKTAIQIISTVVKPFGVNVVTDVDHGQPFKKISIQPEETCFELIDRLCRHRALIPISDAKGNIILTRAGSKLQGELIRGVNIKGARGFNSVRGRFSTYVLKGNQKSSPFASPEKTTHPLAKLKDPGVRRYRPKTILSEIQGDQIEFEDRLAYEVNSRAGKAKRSEIDVKGWRVGGDSGPLWQINQQVYVKHPRLRLDTKLLVNRVTFIKDKRGTVTTLGLALPAAYDRLPLPETKSVGLFE